MIDIDEWRRLAQAATPHVGHACKYQDAHWLREGHVDFENADLFIASERPQEDAAFYAAANPAAISELLDRLEAAEKSDAESIAMYRKARDERDALRAKITEMEQQEPVAWMQSTHLSSFKNRLCGSQSSYVHCSDHQLHPDFKPLYALPGARPKDEASLWQTIVNGMITPAHIEQAVANGTITPAYIMQPAPSVPTSLLAAVADLVAQMEIVARVGFVDTPDDKDSCAAFCVAEGTWLELMSAVESLASALAAAPEAKP